MFVASYLKDAKTQVKMFSLDGGFVREVEFPGIGTAAGFGGASINSIAQFPRQPNTQRETTAQLVV